MTTQIRRPIDFTNTFSKDESGLIQTVLKEISNHLDKVGHADLESTKVHISAPVDLPRKAVVENIVKRLARKGWVATFHKAEYGFHIVLSDDRLLPSYSDEDSSEPGFGDDEHELVATMGATKREWGC